MKSILRSLCVTSLVLLAIPSMAEESYEEIVERFAKAGAREYVNTAFGYAVFPTIAKGGFGIGGAYGEGRVFRQGVMVGSADVGQVSIGFQAGGQAFSQIIFFENNSAFTAFTSGNFEFGAQANAVALTAGASAEATTGGGAASSLSGGKNDAKLGHAGYRKGMAVFTIAKGGLMFEASIGGQKFNYEPLN
ncbi:conserved hypothetical protein [Luminiphilus syltensis NOR5-1B]|uniref:Ysc84 actin-binding domain-containing protein n=1 Tax=Luminiphilus syltensis NOR5-1B TaxID=565045 RepID=B8KT00_9GAMM|nr:YSC84-related protein [Luminiphilus syltensis]EED35046.1 conserved hypothetical protein [Luminiphilus syltensis NOR5-1B]